MNTQQNVPNYLVQSILVCFCCLPFGIPAIVYATQVNGKLQAGDHAGAVVASKSARKWCWIAFWSGLAAAVIVVVLQVMAYMAVGGTDAIQQAVEQARLEQEAARQRQEQAAEPTQP